MNNMTLLHSENMEQQKAGNFVRKEDKYLITQEQADILIPLLQQNLVNASPIPNTDYTVIESIYHDNEQLDVLSEYLNKQANRSKMRTRRYAPNGNWSSDVFLEVKAKIDGICNKSRFQIGMSEVIDLSIGKPLELNSELRQLNLNIKQKSLNNRLGLVNNFIEKLKTKPSSKITYTRLAYEKDSFRVTLDQNVQFSNIMTPNENTLAKIKSQSSYMEMLTSAQNLYANNQFILEVKHSGNIPDWMQRFIVLNNITEASFSKYCYAMSFAVAGKLTDSTQTQVNAI